jgi:hypothetical protein
VAATASLGELMFVASTSVTVLRGTTYTEHGDLQDLNQPVAVKVPFAVTELSRSYSNPDTGESYVVRRLLGRVRGNGVQAGDRLRDERTGATYVVDAIAEPGPFMAGVQTLELTKQS